jgi:uncharacterized protein (TIGR02118 family)
MIKVIVSYPNQAGARFNLDYYLTKHMPLVAEKIGGALKGWSAEQGVGGGAPGAPAEFMIQATLTMESVEAFQAAMATVGPVIMADIPNYTDIQPHIQVNQILGQHPALAAGA